MATPVVSLPVPAVVGTGQKKNRDGFGGQIHKKTCYSPWWQDVPAMSGFSGFLMGFPLPIGALTKSRKSASGWQAYRLAALQVSITDPPPTATNTSNEPFLANAMASLKLQHRGDLVNLPKNILKNWPLNSWHRGVSDITEFTSC